MIRCIHVTGLIATLVVGAAVPGAPVAEGPSVRVVDVERSALELMREGVERYDAGDFAEAEALFRAAALADDAPLGALFNEACALYRQGDLEGAARAFREAAAQRGAARLAGNSAYNLGLVGLERADLEREVGLEALDPVPQVFGVDPDGAWRTYEDAIGALIEQYAQAGADFREALASDPDDADAARNFALTRQRIRTLQQERKSKRQQFDQLREQLLQPQDAAQQLEALAQEQQQQAETTAQGEQSQDAASAQRQTSQETQALMDHAQETSELAQQARRQAHQASEPTPNEQMIEQAAQALDQAREQQEQAEQALRQGDQQAASQAQQDAATTLREAAQQLRDAMEQQSSDSQEGDQPPGEDQPQQGEPSDQSDQQGEGEAQTQANAAEDAEALLEQQVEQLIEYLLAKEEAQRDALEAMQRARARPKPVERDW